MTIAEDCPVDGAITPGLEFVGKVARVGIEPHNDAVKMEVCDPFFDRSCMPTFDPHYTWSALQRGTELVAGATAWAADCFCFEEVAGTRSMTGEVTAEGEAELEWSVTLAEVPLDCECDALAACTASVQQLLSLR